jgi:hypothetical protein
MMAGGVMYWFLAAGALLCLSARVEGCIMVVELGLRRLLSSLFSRVVKPFLNTDSSSARL